MLELRQHMPNITTGMYACMHVNVGIAAAYARYNYRYVCMYACMHVCMYACMHVCMCACVHVCMLMLELRQHMPNIATGMHVCMYACVHVCMLMLELRQIVDVDIHTYIHTRIHTHMHDLQACTGPHCHCTLRRKYTYTYMHTYMHISHL